MAEVLTVAKVTAGGAAGYAEYLEGRSTSSELGDYYLKDGERVEAPGRWVGDAATVGCDPDRPVTGEQLRALLAVRHPQTNLPLRRAGGNGEAVAALDATFSAPKSVSVVWALADPGFRERIEAAHERAIDRTLAYSSESVAMIRQRVGASAVVHALPASVLATSWRHATARAVDGRPPDPQLHSHVLLHGAVRRDGRIVAIDSRAWLVHRRELGAAYRTELARELRALGFEIRRGTGRGRRYFEIDGVPTALIDRWSGRHHQVQEAITARLRDKQAALQAVIDGGGPDAAGAGRRLEQLIESGQLAAGEDRLMTAATRSPKHQLVTRADLDRHWTDTGQAEGLNAADVQRLRSVQRPLAAAERAELLQRLTEFDATFAERDTRAVALEASTGVGIDQSLWAMHNLRLTGDLLGLSDGRETTRQHRRTEHQTVALAHSLAAGKVEPIESKLVLKHTTQLDKELNAAGARLSDEQRGALTAACSDAQLVVIEGQAGTGKSTVLTGVARAHQAAGQQVIVTSTAALAAERLAAELATGGVDVRSYSTGALHAAIATGSEVLGRHSTVIHDEAALASTREQQRLLSAVTVAGARLIEVGDPLQSKPVGAGGLWERLERATQDHHAHVELTHNVRALDSADRRDQARVRDQHHEDAIRGYASRGRVTITREQSQAEDAALEAAHHDVHAGKRTLVIAQTSNDHLDELNARAQAIRRQHHELGAEGLDVAGRPYRLHAGDRVQIRRSITLDAVGQLRNGQTGLVTKTDAEHKALTLDLGHNRRATLDRAQIDRADLRLAYVQHPFPAQGQTTDTAHLIVAENATQEGTYVALTRARQRSHIYASDQQLDQPEDPLNALAEHIARSEPDVPSIQTPLAHEAQIHDEEARGLTLSQPSAAEPARAERVPIVGDLHSEARTWHGSHEPQPGNVVELLGPRPAAGDRNLAAWEHAAEAIERYRCDYEIPDSDPAPLGPEPPPGAFQQSVERRDAAEIVYDAQEQLRGPDAGPHSDDERRRGQALAADAHGWEP